MPGFDSTGEQMLVWLATGTTVEFHTSTWQPTRVFDRADHGGAVVARLRWSHPLLRRPAWTLSLRMGLSKDGEYLLTIRDSKPRLWHLSTSTMLGAFPPQDRFRSRG